MPDNPEIEEEIQEPVAPEDDVKVEATVQEWLAENDSGEEETSAPAEESKEEAEKPEEAVEEQTAKEPVWDDVLLRDAEYVGLSKQEIDALGPEGTRVAVNNAIRIAQSFQRQQEPAPKDEAKEEPKAPPVLDDDVDDSIRAAFDWLKNERETDKQTITELRDELHRVRTVTDNYTQRELDERAKRGTNEFISDVQRFGMPELFGEDVERASDDQWNNILDASHIATVLHQGYKTLGEPVPDDLNQRAIYAALGDRIKKGAVQDLSSRVQRRSRGAINRPTQRVSNDSGSDEKAIQTANEWLAREAASE